MQAHYEIIRANPPKRRKKRKSLAISDESAKIRIKLGIFNVFSTICA